MRHNIVIKPCYEKLIRHAATYEVVAMMHYANLHSSYLVTTYHDTIKHAFDYAISLRKAEAHLLDSKIFYKDNHVTYDLDEDDSSLAILILMQPGGLIL